MTGAAPWWLLAAAVLAGCTGTTYDESLATTIPHTVMTTTTTLPATTAGLLGEMLAGARAMSAVISDDGDADALLAAITQRWTTARPAVEAERPALLADFETAVRMLGTAARFDRAADADKAAKNLAALVAAYGS